MYLSSCNGISTVLYIIGLKPFATIGPSSPSKLNLREGRLSPMLVDRRMYLSFTLSCGVLIPREVLHRQGAYVTARNRV